MGSSSSAQEKCFGFSAGLQPGEAALEIDMEGRTPTFPQRDKLIIPGMCKYSNVSIEIGLERFPITQICH